MLEVDMGGVGAERPLLHWQCQLGTPYSTIITANGVTITVVRRITNRNFTVPYYSTSLTVCV